MDTDKNMACVTAFGKSFACAQDWHVTAYEIAYVSGFIYAYRGLCISLPFSMHHLWHQLIRNRCWTSLWGKKKCCNHQNFGRSEKHFLRPVLWAAVLRPSWFCWSEAWLDRTCFSWSEAWLDHTSFSTDKKDRLEMAQKVTQMRHACPLQSPGFHVHGHGYSKGSGYGHVYFDRSM